MFVHTLHLAQLINWLTEEETEKEEVGGKEEDEDLHQDEGQQVASSQANYLNTQANINKSGILGQTNNLDIQRPLVTHLLLPEWRKYFMGDLFVCLFVWMLKISGG